MGDLNGAEPDELVDPDTTDVRLRPTGPLAPWLEEELKVEATAVRGLGLARARDPGIFEAARREDAVVMTKDSEF